MSGDTMHKLILPRSHGEHRVGAGRALTGRAGFSGSVNHWSSAILFILFILLPSSRCQRNAASPQNDLANIPPPAGLNRGWNRNLNIQGVAYDVFFPDSYHRRTILVLPGWNYPKTGWIENSSLAALAQQHGYALVLPEMLKTLYESSYYPQTTLKWNPLPGGDFIKNHFLPDMQKKHNIFLQGSASVLLGLSTGGRGVALTALENPGLFVAGAALSGDYDQALMPTDNLMTLVYGPISSFRSRWTGRDNPAARAGEWKMPLYLSHGLADRIIPEEQSRIFYEALRKMPGVTVEYHPVPGGGHDYRFWNGQLTDVFAFFERIIAQKESANENQ